MNTLEQQLLGLAEIGSNRLLELAPDSEKLCAELQGHIIAIELIDLNRTLYFHPGSWGMRLSLQAPPKDVDATIRGHVLGLISLSGKQDRISTSIRERIEISGNTRVAQKFQKILTGIDIDWEEQLSKYTGDIMAYRVGQGLRKTQNWVMDNLNSFALSGREYLQEETHQLPTQPEFIQFKQAVTSIRDDVERLEALINHKFGSLK
jgi:ubiquinone biosynthesis protein UbiJ